MDGRPMPSARVGMAAPDVTLEEEDSDQIARQRGSHRSQLAPVQRCDVTPGKLDAIVVPTARPSVALEESIRLAKELGCALLALCSKDASAAGANEMIAEAGIDGLAIDVDLDTCGVLPAFGTDRIIAGSMFRRCTDLSAKRNLGLLLARVAGWQRIVFLDDDIKVPEPTDLLLAAGLTDTYPIVGIGLSGYPDNSVVCHANREVGKFQETFIGGGAMAVSVPKMTSFFPNIYNEDWFFVAATTAGQRRSVAVVGKAVQQPYDPYDRPERASGEELGDCLAEGLYALVDVNELGRTRKRWYWREFLKARRTLIDEILVAVANSELSPEAQKHMNDALHAAFERNLLISPKFCVDYLSAWREDRRVWAEWLAAFPVPEQPRVLAEVVEELKLRAAVESVLADAVEQGFDENRAELHFPEFGVDGMALDGAVSPVVVAEPGVEADGFRVVDVNCDGNAVVAGVA